MAIIVLMSLDVARERETRPGSWVVAAMEAAGVDEIDLVVKTHRSLASVYRWRKSGIDYIAWVGLLALLGLPITWEPAPPPKKVARKAS